MTRTDVHSIGDSFFVENTLKSGLKVIHSVHHLSFRKNLNPKFSGKPIFLNNYCDYISFNFFLLLQSQTHNYYLMKINS